MLDPEVMDYYNRGAEDGRLGEPRRSIEFLRTMDILSRHLPDAPADILDIGGGPGRYAAALAQDGYKVTLLDPVPLHVQQAHDASRKADRPLARIMLGDSRDLGAADQTYDAVLMLGPLYHLPDPADRARTWTEAHRVTRDGGTIVAASISRYYTTWEMLSKNKLDLPGQEDAVAQHITTGQHRNPDRDFDRLFTTSYFHDPDELADEARSAGLIVQAVLAVEGPAKLLPDLADRVTDTAHREQLLRALRRLEGQPSTLGASEHNIVIARAQHG